MTAPDLLTVADVARLRRCDHSTAWRLLQRLARDHQAKLIRHGRTVQIARDELRAALARMPGLKDRPVLRELATVRRRLDVLEAEVRRLRQLAPLGVTIQNRGAS